MPTQFYIDNKEVNRNMIMSVLGGIKFAQIMQMALQDKKSNFGGTLKYRTTEGIVSIKFN